MALIGVRRALIRPKPKAAAGGSPAYAFQGSDGTSSPIGTTNTFSIDIGTASADRVLIFATAVSSNPGITSVVLDPGGLNITMTQAAFYSPGSPQVGLYYASVPSGTGTKGFAVTYGSSVSFFAVSAHLWKATGLTSGTPVTTATGNGGGTSAGITISVTSPCFLFGLSAAQNGGVSPAYNYSTSTITPSGVHGEPATQGWSADWTIAATNASFSIVPTTTQPFAAMAFVTFH